MQVQLKLMGTLKEKTPPDNTLELPEGATIDEVLKLLGISFESVAVCTVNGQLVRDRSRPLAHGDDLSILPPVGGG